MLLSGHSLVEQNWHIGTKWWPHWGNQWQCGTHCKNNAEHSLRLKPKIEEQLKICHGDHFSFDPVIIAVMQMNLQSISNNIRNELGRQPTEIDTAIKSTIQMSWVLDWEKTSLLNYMTGLCILCVANTMSVSCQRRSKCHESIKVENADWYHARCMRNIHKMSMSSNTFLSSFLQYSAWM